MPCCRASHEVHAMEGTGDPDIQDEEEDEEDEGSGSWSDDGGMLGATLNGDALARSLLDTQTANELGLVRSEVKRLKCKIERVEVEKDGMAEDFRNTTKVLINRIKELEAELTGWQSRPQTAAVIERIENRGSVGGRALARPPTTPGLAGGRGGTPQVMSIQEGEETSDSPPRVAASAGPAGGPGPPSVEGETTLCGNCRRNIPAGNVLAHSVSCYRNNFRCDACDEVLALRDKDSHMQEWRDPERLVDAVGKRDVELVQRMLGHNADVCNAVHPTTKDTAMHAAARIGDEELVAFLTAHGVEIDFTNEQKETPLLLACATASDKLPSPSSPSSSSGLAGPSPAVRLLVELGASLDVLNARGETALMLLCRRGIAQTARFLVEMKADTEICNQLGDTPLQIAQRQGHQETVLALCTAGTPLRVGTPSRSADGSRRSPTPSPGELGFGSLSSSNRARSASPMPGLRAPTGGRSSAPSPPSGLREPSGGYPPRPRESRSKGASLRSGSHRGDRSSHRLPPPL